MTSHTLKFGQLLKMILLLSSLRTFQGFLELDASHMIKTKYAVCIINYNSTESDPQQAQEEEYALASTVEKSRAGLASVVTEIKCSNDATAICPHLWAFLSSGLASFSGRLSPRGHKMLPAAVVYSLLAKQPQERECLLSPRVPQKS